MIPEPTTQNRAVSHLTRILFDSGMTDEDVKQKIGIQPEMIFDPDMRITVGQFILLWETAIQLTGNRALALQIREGVEKQDFHFTTRIILHSKNLLEGLQHWIRYSRMICKINRITWREEGKHLLVSYRNTAPQYQNIWFPEYHLAMGIRIARHMCGEDISAVETRFQHPDPGYGEEYRKVFGGEVYFQRDENLVVLKKADTEHRCRFHDPYIQSVFKQHTKNIFLAASPALLFQDKVREFIIDSLSKGTANTETASAHFNMGRATLHRKLKKENTTFRSLIEHCRKELAKNYLKQGMNSSQIAHLLGFSEPAAFQHAFKRWFGTSPGELRKDMETD